MKRHIFLLFFLLLAGFDPAFGQTPILQWNQTFSFGGTSDQMRALAMDSAGNYYVGGERADTDVIATVTKLSPERVQLWTSADTVDFQPFVWDLAFSEAHQLVLSGNANGYVVAYDTAGNERWRTFVETAPLIQVFGDSILAVPIGENVRAVILDGAGTIIREFPIMPLSRYLWDVEILGDDIWVFGGDYDGALWNAGIFVSKFNLRTGEHLWTYHVPDGLPASGDVDEEGNAYLGATRLVWDPPGGTNQVWISKIDPSGNALWETAWFANSDPQANFETYIAGVAVSDSRSGARQVIIAGQTQKWDSSEHIGERSAYMAGLDAGTGDTLWIRKWEQVVGEHSSFLNDAFFDSRNRLIVGGNYFFYPPVVGKCFVESYEIPGVTLAVRELPLGVPEQFALSQNYPNPFNPKTLVRFEIPSVTDVKLVVYNALGEEVAVLAEGRMNPGFYEADWDATGMPSGMYFYRLRTETFSETKKMLLVK